MQLFCKSSLRFELHCVALSFFLSEHLEYSRNTGYSFFSYCLFQWQATIPIPLLFKQLTVILMNSLVIMENVYLKAMSVTSTVTVEITVTKKDVVCDIYRNVGFFLPEHVHVKFSVMSIQTL